MSKHPDDTQGAALIGLIAASILYGISNLQTLIYYQSSQRDPLLLRLMVAFLWCLDTIHIVLISDAIYDMTVWSSTKLHNHNQEITPPWSFCFHFFIVIASNLIVRLFYARRVWILSKHNWLLTCSPVICALITSISGSYFTVKTYTLTDFNQFDSLSYLLYLALGCSAGSDVIIAASLCYYLSVNRTGFAPTDTKINTLMVYVINTGLLTSLCAICSLVSFALNPHALIYIAFYFVLSKISFNSLLATLNARERLRDPSACTHNFIGNCIAPRPCANSPSAESYSIQARNLYVGRTLDSVRSHELDRMRTQSNASKDIGAIPYLPPSARLNFNKREREQYH